MYYLGERWYPEFKDTLKEIRFQFWLGAGVYFGRPRLCLHFKCRLVCLRLKPLNEGNATEEGEQKQYL